MSIFSGRLSRKNFGLSILLILVVPVIGILASIVLVSLQDARQEAAQAQLQAQQQQINLTVQQNSTTSPSQ